MSTPSETMFTATIQGSRGAAERGQLLAARDSVCKTTTGALPVSSPRSFAICLAWVASAATAKAPASRWPRSRTARNFSLASVRIRGRPSGSSVEIAVR